MAGTAISLFTSYVAMKPVCRAVMSDYFLLSNKKFNIFFLNNVFRFVTDFSKMLTNF